MAVDTVALRASVDLVAVVGSRIALQKKGSEFVGICPFHADTDPSLHVVPARGFYHCFACGAHGDAIDFLRELDGLTFKEAAEALGGTFVPLNGVKHERTPKASEWVSCKPPSDQQAPESFVAGNLGEPVRTWAYRDAGGDILSYVCRYEVADGSGAICKTILCHSFGSTAAGEKHWAIRHPSRPRPLYGLDRLNARPLAQVIVLEGEGKADSAAKLFPQSVAMSWSGGANGVKAMDWTPLKGRKIVLIPDNDDPGREAVAWVRECLLTLGCTVKVIEPESTKSKGWNLDDAEREGWSPADAMAWAKSRQQSAPAPEPPPPMRDKPKLRLVDDVNAELSGQIPTEEPENLPPSFSEDHLAAIFTKRYGNDWKYVAEWAQWYRWDGIAWRKDSTLTVFDLARQVCRDAAKWDVGEELTKAMKRSITSAKTHAAVERIARSSIEVAATVNGWDRDPWQLCTPAGIVDLKTGAMHPPAREALCTKVTGVAPGGDCPQWLGFIDQITKGDADLAAYLQRLAGYCLTGSFTHQMFAFFYGKGGNGKGVFLRVMRGILGEYACTASMETFTESRNARHETEFARLHGMRLVTAQETEEGRKWAQAKIQELTGGDEITARFMHRDFFTFKPQFKLIFSGNHKPGVRSVNPAIRRRCHIVPFDLEVTEAQQDRNLDAKLEREWPGILAWAIKGALDFQVQGLSPPQGVVEASNDYLHAEDVMAQWIEECCEVHDTYVTRSGELYKSWGDWCQRSGEFAGSAKRFLSNIKERGFHTTRSGGYTMIHKLRAKPSEDEPPPLYWANQ